MNGLAPTFALIGAAGYIAPRHMKAIRAVGGNLVAACDLHDSVGILDSFFPSTAFFQSPPAFFSYCKDHGVDYLAVCTPNHRHVDHILMGFDAGMDIVCEKPLVLGSPALSAVEGMQAATGRRVNAVLQLRHLPEVARLRSWLAKGTPGTDTPHHEVRVDYVTRRGAWYYASWKGDPDRSGGIAANIGAHLFDLLAWTFAIDPEAAEVDLASSTQSRIVGRIHHKALLVNFRLSVCEEDLPPDHPSEGPDSYAQRVLTIDGMPIDLTPHFGNMHEEVYRAVLRGEGWTTEDVKPGLRLLEHIAEWPAPVTGPVTGPVDVPQPGS